MRKTKIVIATVNIGGGCFGTRSVYSLTYFGVVGRSGRTPHVRVRWIRTAKSTLATWRRRYGEPDQIVGEELLQIAESERR
jgi:hypothetical protein